MADDQPAFPPPPYFYKHSRREAPVPPQEGEFSMFGRSYTVISNQTKESKLAIEAADFQQLISDATLQAGITREILFKMQFSLLNSASEMLKALAINPEQAVAKVKDYEQLILNFYQLIYWLRPAQALEEIKETLIEQTKSKEQAAQDLIYQIESLRTILKAIIQ